MPDVTISADQTASPGPGAQQSQFLRFFADLPIKFRMIVRSHAALKRPRCVRAIKELRCDPQRTDPVASGPGGTNLVGEHCNATNKPVPRADSLTQRRGRPPFYDQPRLGTVAGVGGRYDDQFIKLHRALGIIAEAKVVTTMTLLWSALY